MSAIDCSLGFYWRLNDDLNGSCRSFSFLVDCSCRFVQRFGRGFFLSVDSCHPPIIAEGFPDGNSTRGWLVVLALIMIKIRRLPACLPYRLSTSSSLHATLTSTSNSIISKRQHVRSTARKTIEEIATAATIQGRVLEESQSLTLSSRDSISNPPSQKRFHICLANE
jgi:hypothetical protein